MMIGGETFPFEEIHDKDCGLRVLWCVVCLIALASLFVC